MYRLTEVYAVEDLWTQSLILHQMLTIEDGLNLRKIKADGFVTVTLHQPKRYFK